MEDKNEMPPAVHAGGGGEGGIPTGFQELDLRTGGLHPGELIVIAAEPSVGKTSFLLSLAEEACIKGNRPGIFFSLQADKAQVIKRMLSMRTEIGIRKMRDGRLTPKEFEKLLDAGAELSEKNALMIDDMPAAGITEISERCRKEKQVHGLTLVWIDSLELMGNPAENAEEGSRNRGKILEKLKALALELKAAIIVSAQIFEDSGSGSNQKDALSVLSLIGVTEENTDEALVLHRNHPFRVVDDEAMLRTTESISQYGVLTPLIARPMEDGGYEIISGHRRHHAAELAGITEIPVIVRDLDDDAATILMVDANLQRETILPSERAQAYKMKLEAIKHQGQRNDIKAEKSEENQGVSTSAQVEQKLPWAVNQVAEDSGQSRAQVQRYIRLTELIPELQEMVDNKQLAFNPAVELSYLKKEEQQGFLEAMEYGQSTPSLSQAQRLKKLSQDGKCTNEAMCAVMDEEKKGSLERLVIKTDVLRKFFPKSYTVKQMEDTIMKLLEQWQRKKERQQER